MDEKGSFPTRESGKRIGERTAGGQEATRQETGSKVVFKCPNERFVRTDNN